MQRSLARAWRWFLGAVVGAVVVALPASASAQDLGEAALSQPIVLVLLLALAALAPFLFMSLTAFVKISTVLQITRGALGAQNIPSNTVILALAGALTVLTMAPVGSKIMERASPLFEADGPQATSDFVAELIQAAREPMQNFLEGNASERERTRFFELARGSYPANEADKVGRDDLTVVIPAFVVTELIEAFALGFAIYLPFLVIDLVVANVLLSLGMQMMSPTQIALPFKLLLFVAVDGWGLLSQALISGYAPG
jgi:type III secretion protein R